MLADSVIVLVPAVLAFVAAITGSLLAYRQWKRQPSLERKRSFETEQAAAYKELWSRLEAIHVRLRAVEVRDDEFDSDVRDLNSFILGSEIYFEPDIRARATEYLAAVRQVSAIIRSQPTDVQHDWSITGTPLIDSQEMTELAAALEAAEEARNSIMGEVRANIGAGT